MLTRSNPFLLVLFSVFCGVTAPYANLPYFWRSWMYWLVSHFPTDLLWSMSRQHAYVQDPFTWLIKGLVTTALHDVPVVCRSEEFNVFRE